MKLHQVIALEKGVKSRVQSAITAIYHDFKETKLFAGLSRTYQPKDDDGERFPAETTLVQKQADQLIREVGRRLTEIVDITAQKDYANTTAKADVVLDGKVIIKDAPVPFLLYLEKVLRDWKAELTALPELDPSVTWAQNKGTGLWQSEPVQTTKTAKVPKPIVKYDATKEHPAQTEVFTHDIIVGYWTAVRTSGALASAEKAELLARFDRLSDAVKVAREAANEVDAPAKHVAQPLFDYLLGPTA